jgi:putative hydrolase of the HAD superfamily
VAKLDAVLFDLDDTLVPTTAFARQARLNAVRAMVAAGLAVPVERAARELEEVIAEFSSNYEAHYDKLLLRLGPEATRGVNPALVVAAGVVAYHDTKFRELRPYPDVLPLLAGLRGAGVRCGILTHGWTVKQAEKLVRLGLVPLLEPGAVFISDQIGISKPNPKLWSAALAAMGVAPARAMYVGDHPEHDVQPPKSLGMAVAWASRGARVEAPDWAAGLGPDHVVRDFVELAAILRERYGVALSVAARPSA